MKIIPVKLICACIAAALAIFNASLGWAIVVRGYDVTYQGRTYDATRNVTTFSYKVCGTSAIIHEISHFDLGIPVCQPAALNFVSASPTGYEDGGPHTDPNTGVYGIKWENNSQLPDNCQCKTYSITYAGNIPQGNATTLVAVKAGNGFNTALLNGAACSCSANRAPVCNIGGPYAPLSCEFDTASLTLDGSASFDPDGDTLTYRWTTDCSDGAFANSTASTTNLSLTPFSGANGDEPIACVARLVVSDGRKESECTTAISSSNCSKDCSGTRGGTKEFDICNVCAGDGTSCLDCSGIPFGTTNVDRCGVCAGDGNSCLGCNDQDITAMLFNLDGNSGLQKRLILKSLKGFIKLSGNSAASKKIATRIRKEVNELHSRNWTLAWSLPQVSTTCSNTIFCVQNDNTPILKEFLDNSAKLLRISRELSLRKRKLGSSAKNESMVLKRASDLHAGNSALTFSVPVFVSVCI